jgi:WD40 repeat protein
MHFELIRKGDLMPKYMDICLLLFLIFFFSLDGAICKPISVPSDLTTVIEEKLDLGDPYVEQTAVTMARDYPGEFSINQVGAIYDSLVQGWNYLSDPSSKELYKNANLTLQDGMRAGTVGVGDCDDFAILISSLIDSLGGSTRIIFAYDEASRQGHAYSELYLGKKDSPLVEDLNGWIKDEYGKPSVPGARLTGDEVWLNLDYNGTYPGGSFFGENWVSRTVAWESKNKTSPKIVPLIDPMENLSLWKTLKDDLGSNISIGLVPSKKGRAINLSYELKDNGWVGISRDVDPKLLAELQGLNISYRMIGKQSTLEIRLEDQNGTIFGSSWMLGGDQSRWVYLEALYDGFAPVSGEISLKTVLESARIKKLEFVMHNNIQNGDVPGPGSINLDQIQGVMRVHKDSPWARAKDIRGENVALDLASKSQMVLESKSTDSLTKSILLAVESLGHKETLQGSIAIHRGLALLPYSATTLVHNGKVYALAFSPDGTRLATASGDNASCIWDIRTGKKMQRLEHEGFVYDVTFSPDGRTLATGCSDRTARLWDVQTGRELQRLKNNGFLWVVAFSPSGSTLATGSSDNRARLWDVQTGLELQELEHDGPVWSVAFSPDGTRLASGSCDTTARIWDVQAGTELQRLKHDDYVSALTFSPDGKTLATGSFDKTARLWDVQTGRELQRLEHDGPVNAVAFNPMVRLLATGSSDKTARLWDIQTGKQLQRLEHDNWVAAICFSPNGKTLATASYDNTSCIWDVQTGKQLLKLKHDNYVEDVAFSPDGKTLATASHDKTARLWNVRTGKQPQRLEYDSPVYAVAFSSNGKTLATGSFDKTARLWDVQTGKQLQRLEHDDFVRAVAFSPDGKTLATASYDNTSCIWDVQTGKQLLRLKHDNYVEDVAFCSDGKTLATASYDNTSCIWDVQTGKQLQRLEHNDRVNSVAFSPDGKTLATGSDDKTARLWNVQTGRELQRLEHDGQVIVLAFTPDGMNIATNNWEPIVAFSPEGMKMNTASWDSTTNIWDVLTGEKLQRLEYDGTVTDMAFSPDGKNLATASHDKTARLWDVQSGKELQRLEHDKGVNTVAFSPDGTKLVTASGDKTTRIWDLEASDLMKEACSGLTRNLTPEEWHQYLGDEPYRETCACQECESRSRS